MATIIDMNFWTILGWVCKSLQEENLDECLDYVEMLSYCDDLQFLDELKLIQHFRLAQLLRDAGNTGYQVYKEVVTERTAKKHYHYFLKEEINARVSTKILFTENKIHLNYGDWIRYEYSYNIEEDLKKIQRMYMVTETTVKLFS